MNGNQGLEALAALCGGEAAVVTTDNTNATAAATATSQAPTDSVASAVAPAPPSLAQQAPPAAQPHIQAAPTSQGGQVADSLARQQWQQAVAAAAALGGAPAALAPPPATNPAVATPGLTAQSLALLSVAGLQQGVQQQIQQHQVQQQQQQQQQQQVQAQQQAAVTAAAKPDISSNAALAAMQQLAYFRYIQEQTNAAVAKMGQNAAATTNVNPLLHTNPQAMALALAGQAQQLQQQLGGADATGRHQVLPPAAAPTPATGVDSSSSSTSSMPPPPSAQAGAALPSTLSTAGIGGLAPHTPSTTTPTSTSATASAARQHTAIAPLPKSGSEGSVAMAMSSDSGGAAGTGGVVLEDKKLQKRAANRRSAQLSRKRKKQFIEELKDENDELRRKEQILRSIPDLIVVFDSTGKLWFVSQSVSRFMNMTAQELEGTSFWDRLCEDSVRLLKAAFMDSLAARTDDSDTAPLGSGIWELRLVDKDGSHKVVSLNGVVHFSGDRPECVCSIRPRDDPTTAAPKRKQRKNEEGVENQEGDDVKVGATVSTGNGSNETATTSSTIETSQSSVHFQPLIRVKPQQSVINNGSSSSSGASNRINQKVKAAGSGKRREAARISDGDSASADSGSSDEMGE